MFYTAFSLYIIKVEPTWIRFQNIFVSPNIINTYCAGGEILHSKQSNILFQTTDTIMPLNTPDRYLNPDVIGVSQDTYGHQGIRIFGGDLSASGYAYPCMTPCTASPSQAADPSQQVRFPHAFWILAIGAMFQLLPIWEICAITRLDSHELTKIISTRICFHITF